MGVVIISLPPLARSVIQQHQRAFCAPLSLPTLYQRGDGGLACGDSALFFLEIEGAVGECSRYGAPRWHATCAQRSWDSSRTWSVIHLGGCTGIPMEAAVTGRRLQPSSWRTPYRDRRFVVSARHGSP